MKNLRNLTQSSRRNDPINRRMQGYSFRNFRRRRWSSRCKFVLLFQSNLDLKCSIDAETSLEQTEREIMEYKRSILGLNANTSSRREERLLKNEDDRLPSDLMELIAMDGHDRAHLHESSRRFDDRPIVIVRLRFVIIL